MLVSLKGVFRRKDRGSQVHPHALSIIMIENRESPHISLIDALIYERP